MKVSKVIMIVVALHVLVIGGIFVFEGCSRSKVQSPQLADNESLPGQTSSETATSAAPMDVTSATPALTPIAPTTGAITPTMPPAVPAPAATEPQATTYAVKKGDSLWKIAKTGNVTVAELMKANNLTKTSVLKVGQKLSIPAKAPSTESAPTVASAAGATTTESGASYTVASGDSLWKIANKNGVTVSALKKANNLASDSLKVGQKLTIPSKSAPVAVAGATPTTPVASAAVAPGSYAATFREPGTYQENNQTIHVVDLNDTPAIIAKKYGVRVDELMKANGITDPRQIHYGQTLIVPVKQPAASAPITPAVNTTSSGAAAPKIGRAHV